MSQVFMVNVVFAGPAETIAKLQAHIQESGALQDELKAECFVLAADERDKPTVVHYHVVSSGSYPFLWILASEDVVFEMGLVSMGVLFEEQGEGTVFVENAGKLVFEKLSIYGFSQEGQEEIRHAQTLFSELALKHFGITVQLNLAVDQPAESEEDDQAGYPD